MVTSDLEGGVNGHLGLVYTPLEYAHISFIPYVQPVHPGLLVIPDGTAQHAEIRLREYYNESLRQYRETVHVKKTLTKKLQANDPKYLNELRNRVTSTINNDVQSIMGYLFRCYGIVDDHYLVERELKVRDMQYNLLDPLVMMTSDIEDLEQLEIAANNSYYIAQLIRFALQITKNMRDFEKGATGGI